MIKKLNWDDIPLEQVNPSMQRRIVTGEKMMTARLYFKGGFEVQLHQPVHEQISQVVKGTMRFWFGADKESTMDLHAGDVIVIPSNVPHAALMLSDVEEIDIWSPPRQDWLDGSDLYLRE